MELLIHEIIITIIDKDLEQSIIAKRRPSRPICLKALQGLQGTVVACTRDMGYLAKQQE